MTGRKFPLWTAMGAVLVVALVIGSGVLSSSRPTAAQRAHAIESVVRCPSCEDLSAAVSNAPTAVTVRATVRQLVDEGKGDQQIKDYLVARYGSSIVLDPPASGWSLLVWLVPVLGGAAAMGVVAVALVRRRVGVVVGRQVPATEGPASLDPQVLGERRQFLTLSLADADAEHLAGDLADQDYLALRHRDMVRLAALDARVGVETARPARSGRRRSERGRRSRWFLGGAIAAFAAALIVAVISFASNRLPGQTPTGNISLSQAQQVGQTLNQAATLVNQGQLGQAAQLYQSVLGKHPDNEVAVAQLGWIEYETGLQGKSGSLLGDARAKLNRAVQLDPTDYAVRLYLGTVLLQQDGDAAGAVDQYRRFLADDPPVAVVKQAASELRTAYRQAAVPLPPQVGTG